jgi:hypothetical protein
LNFFYPYLLGGGGGGVGGGGAISSLSGSNALSLSAIFPPTGFFVNADGFIDVDVVADFQMDVVSFSLVVASGRFV